MMMSNTCGGFKLLLNKKGKESELTFVNFFEKKEAEDRNRV